MRDQGEWAQEREMMAMEKRAYRECCQKMAQIYRKAMGIMEEDKYVDSSSHLDIMTTFVELTNEKLKLLKARYLLTQK